MELKYIVKDETNITNILKGKLLISNRLYKKIKDDYIYVNNSKFNFKTILHSGDIITIKLDYKENNSNIVPNEKIKFDIIYEDEWLLIVNKIAGIAVHPSILHYNDSLSNGIKYYYDKNNIYKKIRPINRLDKDTSGIVIFAKNEYIQDNIKILSKDYIAIVNGKIEEKSGIIDKPIARKNNSIIERCIDFENGEKAITHYKLIKTIKTKKDQYLSILLCSLETGRTHQIRVHLASIGYPILGDTLYGENTDLISKQALHCYNMKFIHPINRKTINIVADIRNDMKKIIANL